MEPLLPPATRVNLDDTVRDLWLDRLAQHTHDGYAGVPLSKFPEDLRTYEHMLWLQKPSVVIELGAQFGGSALWFRDRLRTLASYGHVTTPHVVAVDLEVDGAREKVAAVDPDFEQTISFLAGDVTDPDLPRQVEELLGDERACFVIEDSAHVYDTTLAALRGFAHLVPLGGFFVVEDGVVDVPELRSRADWPQGVLPAVRDWLADGGEAEWTVRGDLQLYGITCHPGGFLQRVQAH